MEIGWRGKTNGGLHVSLPADAVHYGWRLWGEGAGKAPEAAEKQALDQITEALKYYAWQTLYSRSNKEPIHNFTKKKNQTGTLERPSTWIHVYIWLSPFAVHLKLSEHCKSVIPQNKKLNRKKKRKRPRHYQLFDKKIKNVLQLRFSSKVAYQNHLKISQVLFFQSLPFSPSSSYFY